MLKTHERAIIVLLHQRGNSNRKIKEITGHDRKSIRKVLDESASAKAPVPEIKQYVPHNYAWFGSSSGDLACLRLGRRSLLEPFNQYLKASLSKKAVHTGQLLHELRQLGYGGSKRSLRRFLHVQQARLLTTKNVFRHSSTRPTTAKTRGGSPRHRD
jgi:hypothetical protein